MTTADQHLSTASVRDVSGTWQRAAMTRLLLRDAMSYLLSATLWLLLVLAVGGLIARVLGWELIAEQDLETLRLEVMADEDGVRIIGSLFALVIAAGVAAVVIPVVLAARTRVYVAAGATRRSVAVGQLVTVAVVCAYVLVLAAVVLLVAGRGVGGAMALVGAYDAGELMVVALRATASLLLAMLAGSAIAVMFLRWPWWVGTLVLAALFLIAPVAVAWGWPTFAGRTDDVTAWWAFDLGLALLAAGLYWLILRRVPVR